MMRSKASAGAGFWDVSYRYTDLGIIGDNGTEGRFYLLLWKDYEAISTQQLG